MHNVWLIAKREYLERIHAKSFLLMTILIPLLMGGLVYGAALANRNSGNLHIAVVTEDPKFGADIKAELESKKESDADSDSENDKHSVSKVDASNQRHSCNVGQSAERPQTRRLYMGYSARRPACTTHL